jgi:hypothetical protein
MFFPSFVQLSTFKFSFSFFSCPCSNSSFIQLPMFKFFPPFFQLSTFEFFPSFVQLSTCKFFPSFVQLSTFIFSLSFHQLSMFRVPLFMGFVFRTGLVSASRSSPKTNPRSIHGLCQRTHNLQRNAGRFDYHPFCVVPFPVLSAYSKISVIQQW